MVASVSYKQVSAQLPFWEFCAWRLLYTTIELAAKVRMHTRVRPGPYFIKVKIILSLKFKINLIFYLIKEVMKHSCLNFFYEIVNKTSIKVKRN